MQDKEQIQKEIDAVRLQLSIADMSAITASEEEKEHWNKRRETLQLRLAALEKDLEESVVYDGDNAATILDDATADAMLQQILSADETPSEPMQPDAVDAMDDVLISRVTETFEEDIPVEDGALRGKQQFDEAKTQENTDDSIDNILFMSADADTASAVDDAAADAMLNEILNAVEEPQPVRQENAETVVPPVIETPQDMPLAVESEKAEEEALAVMDEEPSVPESAQEEQAKEKTAETSAAEEMLQKILNAVNPKPARETAPEAAVEQNAMATPLQPLRMEETPKEEPSIEEQVQAAIAADKDLSAEIERLRKEAEEANARAQAALKEAERMRNEAEEIRLNAETERAMYAAEMELQRGLRARENSMRQSAEQAEKDRLAEKIARRKAEITAIRNELQEIKDSDGAFALREKLLAVQLVLDDDERANAELSYLLTKSIDDVAHALEVAELKRRIAALVAVKKAPPVKHVVHKKKVVKKSAPKKKKAAAPARRRRPPVRAAARRRPAPRYR